MNVNDDLVNVSLFRYRPNWSDAATRIPSVTAHKCLKESFRLLLCGITKVLFLYWLDFIIITEPRLHIDWEVPRTEDSDHDMRVTIISLLVLTSEQTHHTVVFLILLDLAILIQIGRANHHPLLGLRDEALWKFTNSACPSFFLISEGREAVLSPHVILDKELRMI